MAAKKAVVAKKAPKPAPTSSRVPATSRVQASRYRLMREAGRISDEQAAWLQDYEARHPTAAALRSQHRASLPPAPSSPAPTPAPTPAPSSPAPTPPAPTPAPSSPAPTPAPTPAPSSPAPTPPTPSGFRKLDFGAAPLPPMPPNAPIPTSSPAPVPGAPVVPHVPGSCTIEKCPKCKQVQGSQVCGVTGERVWPMMSDDGAQGMAAGILGFVSFVARFFFGKDITPEDAEIAQLGRALREMAYRRASFVSSVDDVFAVAFAVAGFAIRVKNAPALPAPRPAPRASSPAAAAPAGAA